MLYLVLKDFYIWNRNYLFITAFYAVLLSALFPMLRDLHFMYPSLCIQGVCYLIMIPLIQNMRKNGEIMFLSLPISRKMIVRARYLNAYLVTAVTVAYFSILLVILMKFFPYKDYERVMTLGVLVTFIIMISLFISFTMPLVYKFGLILGVVLSAMIPAIFVYITYGFLKDTMFNGMRWLNELAYFADDPMNIPLLILIVGGFSFASLFLAEKLYRNKDVD
ncbi:MAG: ABC-2 transporter permease [bacterium]|nr:ABC-2 transporter permease [bacterium]